MMRSSCSAPSKVQMVLVRPGAALLQPRDQHGSEVRTAGGLVPSRHSQGLYTALIFAWSKWYRTIELTISHDVRISKVHLVAGLRVVLRQQSFVFWWRSLCRMVPKLTQIDKMHTKALSSSICETLQHVLHSRTLGDRSHFRRCRT
jgi:hypothetical protein